MHTWRSALSAALMVTGIAGVSASGVAESQLKFPSRPVRVIVGYTAGGQIDVLARMMAQKMSEAWAVPVVVDNRPGAGGVLAAGMVAKAAPDGHTLLFAGVSFAASAALQPSLPYDPHKDFAGISQIGFGTQALFVGPALGVKSVQDLIAVAKSQPGKLVFASSAIGTGGHLTGERFRFLAGIQVVRVAYKGAPEALIETLTGRSHFAVTSLTTGLPFIKDGKLLVLAVSTPQRLHLLPDVPSMAEVLPDFKRPDGSIGLLAPAGTPRRILNQVGKEIGRILGLPGIREWMTNVAFTSAPSTPVEYDEILRAQVGSLSKLARDAGLRPK